MKTYSLNYLSEAFEIDRSVGIRCTRDVVADLEQTKGRPTFKIATFARALEAYHLKNASNNDSSIGSEAGSSDASSLLAARVRITNASAEAKERANLLASGKVCLIEEVANAVGGVIEVLKENLFAVPARVAERISAHTPEDRIAIFKIVESAVYENMRAVIKSGEVISAGMAASAARGEIYKVGINPLGLGNDDVQ
jgi:hypothetical protein